MKRNRRNKKRNRIRNRRFNRLSEAIRLLSSLNRSLFVVALMVFVSSCGDAPFTNGKEITETRWFDEDITSLYVYDDVDVTLIEADTFRIEVTTGENLMPKITSNVVDGALYLRNENTRLWARSYDYTLDIKVYHKGITHINYMSWGDLKSEGCLSSDTIKKFDLFVEHGSGHIDLNLNCDSLIVQSNDGTSKITVAGTSDYSVYFHNARNNIYALDMISKKAIAYINYEGSIYVNCTDTLIAEIHDFGCIYYKGDAEINSYIDPDAEGELLPYCFQRISIN